MAAVSILYQHGPFSIAELGWLLHKSRALMSFALSGKRPLSTEESLFLEKLAAAWQESSASMAKFPTPLILPEGCREDESLRLQIAHRDWLKKRQAYVFQAGKQQCLRSLLAPEHALSEVFETGIRVLLDDLPDLASVREAAFRAFSRVMQLRLSIALRQGTDLALAQFPHSPGEETAFWEGCVSLSSSSR